MIIAKQLKKSFGKVQAVKDVSFKAENGRITGLLGPNGAGKSTTLRMLYTILLPDGGSAAIDGIDIVEQPLIARERIGVFTHNPGIYPNLTARENIEYYARLYQMSESQTRSRISDLTDMLDMGHILDRTAKGFSQGQRTKVALARALIHEPQNLLLDEPTNGLDVMATRSLRDIIVTLRNQDTCILFSSHVMQEVAALCDETVVVSEGKVVASGSPEALREQTGCESLEEAFITAIGSARGLA